MEFIMKKWLSTFLAVAMLLTLAACGSANNSASIDTNSQSEGQYVDENAPEGVTFDDAPQSDEPVKSIMVYASNGEMFFNNTYDSLCPGLLRITYNAQNGKIDEYQLAFYNKNSDSMDNIYYQLTDAEGSHSNCVTNVRYEGKYILADGVKGYINLSSLEVSGSYHKILEDCQNNEYTKEYSENVYFTWDFYKGIYFYDDVQELDLSALEKEFSWNEGKDTTALSNLLTHNEYSFTADDGSSQTLEVRIADDMMCGLMVFSNYFSPIGTDDYRIDGNTLYVVGNCCRYNEVYYSYMAQLDFDGTTLTATFHLYDENAELSLDNYAEKAELHKLVFDCTAV